MAIALRSYGASPGANSASCVITKPAGLAVGDFMIAHVMSKIPATAITPPANWNTVGSQVQTTSGRSGVFWKFAVQTDVDATSFTFTVGTGSNRGGIAAYTGVDGSAPIDASNQQANATSDTTIETPQIITVAASARVLIFGGSDQEGTSSACSGTNPTCTEVWELVTTSGTDCGSHLWHGEKASPGQIDAHTITVSIAAPSAGHAVSLKPLTNQTFSYTASGGALAGGLALTLFCHLFSFIASGGAVSGGTADLAKTKVCVASGGAISGGSAELAKTKAYAPTGGAQSGGAAVYSRTWAYVAGGGGQSGGAAETGFGVTFQYVASGGAQSGGSAAVSKTKAYAASGGAASGGVALVAKTKAYLADGGGQSGGSAITACLRVFSYTASGGAQSGGTGGLAKTKAYAADGGAESGGAAITNYAPGGVVWQYIASGGAHSGGSAGIATTKAYIASDGASSGGQADLAKTKAYTGTGGGQSGGVAEASRSATFSYVASGGGQSDGFAATAYVPAGGVIYPYVASGGAYSGGLAVAQYIPASGVTINLTLAARRRAWREILLVVGAGAELSVQRVKIIALDAEGDNRLRLNASWEA